MPAREAASSAGIAGAAGSWLQMQAELIGKASGTDGEELETDLDLQKRLFAVLLDGNLNDEDLRSKMEALIRKSPTLSEGEQGEGEIEAAIDQLTSPWIRWFLRYDPAPTLEKVRCPVLALNGTLDLQVPCRENLEAIDAALERGKNGDFTTTELILLNHLFQHAETGAPSEYGKIEETFAPEALELMAKWINKRFGGASKGS
ncbi:MAG TPA: alpha/beta hydrolase [Planctomycetes bacterium]|nr:alpha/beta hydrolase [Planctomycetota bacterium]